MLARAVKTVGSYRSAGAAGSVQKAKKIHTSSKPKNNVFFSAAQLATEDSKLAASAAYKEARAKFTKIPSNDTIEVTKKALEEAGHAVTVVADKKSAFEALKNIIPAGSSINLAGSTSLSEIGLVDFLSGPGAEHWNNLKGKMLSEKDKEKQAELRRQATTSDYAISSVDAITQNGEFALVDASGTRLVLTHSASKGVVYIVGTQKIVKDMDSAWERIKSYVYETESARVRKVYAGAPGSTLANSLVVNTSHPYNKGRFHFVLVKEIVGF